MSDLAPCAPPGLRLPEAEDPPHLPRSRGGWLAISHDLILDRDVPDAALWLWLCLLDLDSTPDAWVGCSQKDLAAHAGWTAGLVTDSGGRRLRHNLRPLEARGWIQTRKRPWRGFSFLTQHQVCRRPDQANPDEAWEKVPRHVFDRLRQDPTLRRSAAGLLRHWLLWRSDAGRYGFTQQTLASFAHAHHVHRSIVRKRFDKLVELGLLLVHTDGELLTVRFPAMPGARPQLLTPAPDPTETSTQDSSVTATLASSEANATAGNNVRTPTAQAPEETSAIDLKKRPTVFRPPVDTDVNTQSGPGSQQTITTADQTADEPPTITQSAPHKPKKRTKRSRDEAAIWAGRTIARCPQTNGLDPRTRGRLRQFLARAWRQQPDRDLEQASQELITELQIAEELDQIHANHVVIIRQVLMRWHSDRLVAPTHDAEEVREDLPPRPTGPTLQQLAERYDPQIATGPDDDACVHVDHLTAALAAGAVDALATGVCEDLEDALRLARSHMAHHGPERALLAVAAAKVRTAYQVSCYETEHGQAHDPQLFALARQSLALAAAQAA